MRMHGRVWNVAGNFHDWTKACGWRVALTWAVYGMMRKLGFQQPAGRIKIKPRDAIYPVIARLGGASDMSGIQQIFVENEYSCMRDIIPLDFILDLGANVGYSSAYFLSCFPNATVVAIEPSPDNFELCRQNLLPYGDRAKVVLGAIWSERSSLVISRGAFGDGREWATQVQESQGVEGEATVEGWDVRSLLHLVGGTQVDLLKCDIERSEIQLFGGNCSSWLAGVRNICIELHGPDCSQVFFNALKDYDYDFGRSGELTICRNLRPKQAFTIQY